MHVMQRTSCLLPARSPRCGPSATRGFSRTQRGTVSVPCLASSSGPGFVSFRSPLAGARGGGSGRDERRRQRHLVLQPFFPSLSMQSKFLPPLREAEAGTPCCRPPRPPRSQLVYAFRCHCMGCGSGCAGEGGWGGEGDNGGWGRGCHLRKRRWNGKGKGQKGRGEKRREKAVV